MAKTVKIEGSMKDPGRSLTEAEFNKLREKQLKKSTTKTTKTTKRRTVKRKTTSK